MVAEAQGVTEIHLKNEQEDLIHNGVTCVLCAMAAPLMLLPQRE